MILRRVKGKGTLKRKAALTYKGSINPQTLSLSGYVDERDPSGPERANQRQNSDHDPLALPHFYQER